MSWDGQAIVAFLYKAVTLTSVRLRVAVSTGIAPRHFLAWAHLENGNPEILLLGMCQFRPARACPDLLATTPGIDSGKACPSALISGQKGRVGVANSVAPCLHSSSLKKSAPIFDCRGFGRAVHP
jgi:hypothetical protein